MAAGPAQPTAVDQRRSRQGQDDATLWHHRRAEKIDERRLLLLLSRYRLPLEQRHCCIARLDLPACQAATTADILPAEEIRLSRRLSLSGRQRLGSVVRSLHMHGAGWRPEDKLS